MGISRTSFDIGERITSWNLTVAPTYWGYSLNSEPEILLSTLAQHQQYGHELGYKESDAKRLIQIASLDSNLFKFNPLYEEINSINLSLSWYFYGSWLWIYGFSKWCIWGSTRRSERNSAYNGAPPRQFDEWDRKSFHIEVTGLWCKFSHVLW